MPDNFQCTGFPHPWLKYMSVYFILQHAIVNGFSWLLFLIVCYQYIEMQQISIYWFCNPAILLNSFISANFFFDGVSTVFYIWYHIICKYWQFYFFSYLGAFYFFFLPNCSKTFDNILSKSGEGSILVLLLILEEKFLVLALSLMLSLGVS